MSEPEDPAPELDVTAIGEAVSSLLKARGLARAVALSDVMAAWPEAVGTDLADRVRPVALRGEELVVEVDSPAWATQVSLLSDRLLAGLERAVGRQVATRVKPRVIPRSQP